MRLKYYSIKRLKKDILGIVGKYLDLKIYRVFFFGSRLQNREREGSDIDIGIEGPKTISLEILSKIREEVRGLPKLPKTFRVFQLLSENV